MANIGYTIAAGYIIDHYYADRPLLVFYAKISVYSGILTGGMSFYADLLRQAFQARTFYQICFFIELALAIISIISTELMVNRLNLGFYGILLAMVITKVANVILFICCWLYKKEWKIYWSSIKESNESYDYEKKNEDNEVFGENNENGSISCPSFLENGRISLQDKTVRSEEKSEKVKEHKAELDHAWNFTKFNAVFTLLLFLGGFWFQFGIVLSSFIFTETEVSAFTSLIYVIVSPTYIFLLGISSVHSTRCSHAMAQKKPKLAKKLFYANSCFMLGLSFVMTASLFLYHNQLASLMTSDAEVQDQLSQMLKVYSYAIPFTALEGMGNSTCRAINKQAHFTILQILFHYLVNFGLIALGYLWFECGVMIMIWAHVIAKITIALSVYILVLKCCWKTEAEEVYRQTKAKEKTYNN